MITNHLYLYKHVLNDTCIYLSKEGKKTYTRTYIFVKLTKQDSKKEIKNLKM
jgi:hypothetical protein